MKASELVKNLEDLIKKYGDLPIELHCECSDPYKLKELKEVSLTKYGEFSDKPKKTCITLLDFEQ